MVELLTDIAWQREEGERQGVTEGRQNKLWAKGDGGKREREQV